MSAALFTPSRQTFYCILGSFLPTLPIVVVVGDTVEMDRPIENESRRSPQSGPVCIVRATLPRLIRPLRSSFLKHSCQQWRPRLTTPLGQCH